MGKNRFISRNLYLVILKIGPVIDPLEGKGHPCDQHLDVAKN